MDTFLALGSLVVLDVLLVLLAAPAITRRKVRRDSSAIIDEVAVPRLRAEMDEAVQRVLEASEQRIAAAQEELAAQAQALQEAHERTAAQTMSQQGVAAREEYAANEDIITAFIREQLGDGIGTLAAEWIRAQMPQLWKLARKDPEGAMPRLAGALELAKNALGRNGQANGKVEVSTSSAW